MNILSWPDERLITLIF